MNLIGYWIESLVDNDYLPPQDFVGEISPALRERIVEYLEHGETFEVYRGTSWCRFGCGHAAMGHAELTDGEWVWPSGLSHYIREHSVRLPEAFVAHVVRGGSKARLPIPDVVPSTQFWVQWCKANSSGALSERLLRARQAADLRAAELRRARWAQLEEKHGASNTKCAFADCTEKALVDLRFCAQHLASLEGFDPGFSAYTEGLSSALKGFEQASTPSE